MTPLQIFTGLASYFILLLGVGFITAKRSGDSGYFLGNKQSIWWMVALGMLSDSMSGVSFISVPGAVVNVNFSYMQVVFGYFVGYLIISYILLPLYYKRNLTSIYEYLEQRFGAAEQKTGAFFFVVSRLLGSAGRLFLTAIILQKFLFDPWGVPFALTVSIIILLILAYTFKGGIGTLVFTDALQSTFLIGGLLVCFGLIYFSPELSNHSLSYMFWKSSKYTSIFNWDYLSSGYFGKHFIGGIFLCVAMTGLDQNMMQKNLSCRSLKDAQKNMIMTAFIVVFVNIVFLSLGVLMIEFLSAKGTLESVIAQGTDYIFPSIALNHLGTFGGMAFVLGLSAATFSSADSVLTTLTTSTYFDLMHLQQNNGLNEQQRLKRRRILHVIFAVLLWVSIMGFYKFSSGAIIDVVLQLANYTYGPLLGLFAFGIISKKKIHPIGMILVSLIVPVVCWYLGKNEYVSYLLNVNPLNWKYKFGYELLLVNGLLSFAGYWIMSIVSKRL